MLSRYCCHYDLGFNQFKGCTGEIEGGERWIQKDCDPLFDDIMEYKQLQSRTVVKDMQAELPAIQMMDQPSKQYFMR